MNKFINSSKFGDELVFISNVGARRVGRRDRGRPPGPCGEREPPSVAGHKPIPAASISMAAATASPALIRLRGALADDSAVREHFSDRRLTPMLLAERCDAVATPLHSAEIRALLLLFGDPGAAIERARIGRHRTHVGRGV